MTKEAREMFGAWLAHKEPYDWCCPDCQELECECSPPRPISKVHPHYKKPISLREEIRNLILNPPKAMPLIVSKANRKEKDDEV